MFAVLPTGYGKSLYYGCLPLVFDRLHGGEERSIVVYSCVADAVVLKQSFRCVHFLSDTCLRYTPMLCCFAVYVIHSSRTNRSKACNQILRFSREGVATPDYVFGAFIVFSGRIRAYLFRVLHIILLRKKGKFQ